MSQKPFDSEELPEECQFPAKIPPPLFALGTAVRWNSASGDCGLVIGMRYIWSKHLKSRQYQYYIAFNADSPSYKWTKFDWGWQEDLIAIANSDFSLRNLDEDDYE